MNKKFKTVEEGIDYAMEHDLRSFEAGGMVYYVDDVDDMDKYKDAPIYENGKYRNGGQPMLMDDIDHAGIGGLFKKIGKGIGSVVKGVGNVAHDFGMATADSFGNRLGIFDIDNDKYKTGFGQKVAGFNDTLQSVTGKIGTAVASTAVPGLGSVMGAVGGQGQQQQQQPQTAAPTQQQNQGMGLDALLQLMPYLQSALLGPAHQQNMKGMYQNGGGPQNRQMIFNLFKQKPMGRYAEGGYSQSSPSYQYNLPVGNKTKISGFLDIPGMIPIQTEVKELIVLPTLDVVKVNAKQRHSKMDEDQVTDVVPENSYILSQFGQVDIYKSEADQIVIETENKPYNLYGTNPEPRVKTLGDLMTKKVMKPADLGRTLINRYKQIHNPGDPFTEQTNMANKQTLGLYLQALIQLSEMDKARKGIDNSIETQMSQQNQLPQMVAANGGRVMKASYNVPKAQDPLVAAVTGLLSTGAGLWSDYQNRKLLKTNTANTLTDISKWKTEQTGLNNLGLGIGAASILGQNPEVKPIIENTSYLEGLQKQLPQQFLDYQQSRNLANRPDFGMYSPQDANALSSQYYSQTLNSQAGLALQAAKERAAMFNNYMMQKGQAENRNIASRTNALNATTTNQNTLLTSLGSVGTGAVTNQQNINSNALQSQLAARGQQTSGLIQMNNQLAQTLANSAALGLQSYNQAQAAKQKEQQQQFDVNSAAKKAQCAAIGGEWICDGGFCFCTK